MTKGASEGVRLWPSLIRPGRLGHQVHIHGWSRGESDDDEDEDVKGWGEDEGIRRGERTSEDTGVMDSTSMQALVPSKRVKIRVTEREKRESTLKSTWD